MPLCPSGHSNAAESKFCSICGHSLSLPLAVGDHVRGYIVESVLSTGGGFSTTYLVRDTQLFDQLRVMKEMGGELNRGTDLATLFEHEARILASLNHPGIPRLYAYFVYNDHYYLIEDYIEGKTLKDLLKDAGVLTEGQVIKICYQLLDILEYIHTQSPPIIHRDIKPDNLMLNDQNKLYLLDFGAVKESVKIQRNSTTGKVSAAIYTEGYAPPEQLRSVVFPSSDLYALGVTMIQLLTNKLPSQLYDQASMAWNWQDSVKLTDYFRQILEKLTHLRPMDRYQSVGEVRDALNSQSSEKIPEPPKNLPVPTFSQEKEAIEQGKQFMYRSELDLALETFQQVIQQHQRYVPAYVCIGDVYFEKGLYDEAMFQYKKSLQLQPDKAEARLGLSMTYHEKGNIEKASSELKQAIKDFYQHLQQDGHNVQAGLGLAVAYTCQGRSMEALRLFKKLSQLDPENAQIYYNWGLAYYKAGQHDKAIDAFEKATLLNDEYVVAFNLLGLACFEVNLTDEAIDAFKQAVSVNPLCDYAHNNLGLAYYSTGHINLAIREFKYALKLYPDFALAHYSLGLAYHQQGDLKKALASFEETIKLNPYFAYAHNNLGLTYFALEMIDEAIVSYKKALNINPDFDYVYNNLGIAYFSNGQIKKSLEYLQRAVQLNPNYFDAHSNLGITYYHLGEFENARDELKKATQLDPRHAETFLNLGNTYYVLGALEDAAQCYGRAIQLEPGNAQAYYNFALALEAQKHYRDAIKAYIKAIELKSNFATAYNNLGYLLLLQSKWDEAITCFNEAIAINPELILAYNNLGTAYSEKGLEKESKIAFAQANQLYEDLYRKNQSLDMSALDAPDDFSVSS